jgi:hypothetical protein
MTDAFEAHAEGIRMLACQAFNTIHDLTAVNMFEQILDLTENSPDPLPRYIRRLHLHGLLVEFVPRDGIERILSAQIVSAHTVAMDRLARANATELTNPQRETALKEAMRSLDILVRLTAQFDRHRAQDRRAMRSETFTLKDREYTIMVDADVLPFNQLTTAELIRRAKKRKEEEAEKAQRKKEQRNKARRERAERDKATRNDDAPQSRND